MGRWPRFRRADFTGYPAKSRRYGKFTPKPGPGRVNNIQFMETRAEPPAEIDEIFDWTNHNEHLQYKANKINDIYHNGSALQKKIASVFLETFLFYSGFFTPLYYLGNNKLTNVAEIIKLIIRDESVHGTYIGYKFQLGFNELPEAEQQQLQDWMYDLLYDLYENEEKYTNDLYAKTKWTDEVLTFLRYNANKALMNLGQEPPFRIPPMTLIRL